MTKFSGRQFVACIVLFQLWFCFPGYAVEGFATKILRLESAGFPEINCVLKVFTSQPTELGFDNFKVREDQAEIASFAVKAEKPTQYLILVLDRSSSIEAQMPEVKKAAGYFIKTMPQRVKAGVISFASDVEIDHPCSDDRKQLLQAIEKIRPYGGTCLYDAISQGCSLLAQTGKRTDLKTLVVLTDGNDSNPRATGPMSIKTLPEAIESARKHNINVFAIGLGHDIDYNILAQIARQTGGASLKANDTVQLQKIYQKLSQRLELEKYISLTWQTPRPEKNGSVRLVSIESAWQGIESQGSDTYRAPLPPPVAPDPDVAGNDEPASYTFNSLELNAEILPERLFEEEIYQDITEPQIKQAFKTLVDSANVQISAAYQTANTGIAPILTEWNRHISDKDYEPLAELRRQGHQLIDQARENISSILDQVEVAAQDIVAVIPDEREQFLVKTRVKSTLLLLKTDIKSKSFLLSTTLTSNSHFNITGQRSVNHLNESEKRLRRKR